MRGLSLKELFEFTATVVERRARLHRNRVITMVVLALGAGVTSLIFASGKPLLLLLAAIPIMAFSILRDLRCVREWQSLVLESWTVASINPAIFARGLRALKGLPPQTIESMLHTLPLEGMTDVYGGPANNLRVLIAACAELLSVREFTRLRTGVVAGSIVVATIITALWSGVAFVMMGLLVVVPVYIVGKVLDRSHVRSLNHTLDQLHSSTNADTEIALGITRGLLTSRLSAREQQKLFSTSTQHPLFKIALG